MIAWTSVVNCGNIQSETCPKDGPATIEVGYDSYIKFSGILECSFVIKPKSVLFVKVEMEFKNSIHYITFFNGHTISKSCKYNPKEILKYIITSLEFSKAEIQGTLNSTLASNWHQIAIDRKPGNSIHRSEIMLPTGKGILDLTLFVLDRVLSHIKIETLKTATTTTTKTTTKDYQMWRRKLMNKTNDLEEESERSKKYPTTKTQENATIEITKNLGGCPLWWWQLMGPCTESAYRITSPYHSKSANNSEASSISNTTIALVLSLILLGVLVIFLSVALVVQVALKSQNQIIPVVSFSNNVIHVQATTNSEIDPEGSSSNHQEIRNVSNVQSISNVPSVSNIPSVPNVPRSLPSYSECEFDQHNQNNLSSTNQEPPSYDDALKVELNLIMQPYVGIRL